MIEYNQKQSKEIYDALLDSKVDLLEYFLGPDPRKSSYYKKHVNATECNQSWMIIKDCYSNLNTRCLSVIIGT